MSGHLYDTTDYRRFLSITLEEQERTRREFARALGRSDAYVSLVLKGSRRLDPELVEPASRFIRLNEDEATYLGALVDLDSTSPRAKRSAWATVQARQRHHAVSKGFNDDIAAMYERWYVPAVFELAGCEGFRPDARWIAHVMCPKISQAEAEEALTLLVRLGALEADDEGGLRRIEHEMWSPSLVPGDAATLAAHAHRASLELASEALQRFRYNERHLSSFTVAMSEERGLALLARLAEVALEMLHQAGEPDPHPSNRVYHLALQLFPMSDYSDTEYVAPEPDPPTDESE